MAYGSEFLWNRHGDKVLNPGNPKKRRVTRRFALICVIGVVVMLGACAETPEEKSKFFSSFSTGDAVQKTLGPLHVGAGFSVSGSEASVLSGSRRTYHRDQRADLTLSQSDEPSFLQKIKDHIEQQIQINGCKMTSAGSGEGYYSIAYTDGRVHGWIDIWGLRGSGDNYRLAVTITEN